jgi:hypothetical protein
VPLTPQQFFAGRRKKNFNIGASPADKVREPFVVEVLLK